MSYASEITIPWKLERKAPPFEGNDIKYPEGLVRHILENYSNEGDKVLDPFAGLGTTLFVAEEMKRVPYGIEAEEEKYEWVAAQLENWMNLINSDAAFLEEYNFPKMDVVITSPPYMPKHHKWNPLYGGDPDYAGYNEYLNRMEFIFSKISNIMKKQTPLFVQVDNLLHQTKSKSIFTPLVHDIINCLKPNFIQTNKIKVNWGNPKKDYPYTNLLVFKKR